jgi:dTDP-glucose 4,6-dehydratase
MPMRILVTGGAGFIGSHFAKRLLRAGDEVVVLDKLTYSGNRTNLPDDVEFHEGDIAEPADVRRAARDCAAIVNFAAETHVDRSIGGAADEFVRTNVLGAQQVFAAALRDGVPTVLQVSTDEVYGSIATGSWTEDDPPLPNSPYAASKAAGDLVARSYAITYGQDVRITRCSNNYGPYQYPEKLIPLFVTNLLDGRPVPLYGDGDNVRAWLHVADHCRAVALVAEHGSPGEIYNVGGGRELTNRELTARLLETTGRDESYVVSVADPRGGGHDRRYSVDYSKLAALGYQPQVAFEDGLTATVRWYRDNREWWEPLRR